MDQLVSVLVEKIEQCPPEVIKALQGIDKEDAISEVLHVTYLDQIASAQAYHNIFGGVHQHAPNAMRIE